MAYCEVESGALQEEFNNKGMEVAEDVGKATGRVVDGLTGENPGQYIRDTLSGKKKE